MSRQQKSSLANGTETRSSRLAQLEVQRESVASSHVPDDQPTEPLATLTDMETGEVVLEFDGGDTEAENAADDAASDAAADAMEEEADRAMAAESGSTWTENDAPRLSDAELGTAPPPLVPIELSVRRDHTLVVQALEHRVSEIEKLAKKNDDSGYPKEARTLQGDAAAIGDVILPQFKTQIEMPLVSGTELNYGIKNALKPLVHAAAVRINHAGDARADADQAEASLIDQLAIKVGSYAREVATQAYNAGVAYRESEPAAIAQKALDSLSGPGVM